MTHRVSWRGVVLLCGLVLNPGSSYAGQQKTPGHSIGQVSTNGDLIVIELDRAALGQSNLFDLVSRTLRFSPARSRYRVTNQILQWEADYGVELLSVRRWSQHDGIHEAAQGLGRLDTTSGCWRSTCLAAAPGPCEHAATAQCLPNCGLFQA